MRSPLTILTTAVDGFLLPGSVDSVERVRARFFLAGSVTIAVVIAVGTVAYAVAPSTGVAELLPLVALLVPLATFPFLLRRGVSLTWLGGGLIVLIQSGLTWSAVLDRGLEDVAFLWFVASPLFAALVGGARLAGLSVITTAAGTVGVLVLAESGYVFPDLMTSAFAKRYHAANVVVAAGVVALFAWLYEGPLLARARALALRLRTANIALRRELEARRAAQARAEAASRAKDLLLANFSHEFRTPLTAILCALELLGVDASEDDQALHETASRGARRLLATLTGVLDMVEVESGGRLAAVPVDLVDVAREAAAWSSEAAAAKGVVLVVDGASAPPALADPDVLPRLLGLLVDNGVRFTERGSVTVRVRPVPEGVAAWVTDTGIGMTPAFVARAMEPFTQASEGDARTHEGLGLGLALAQRLALSMGGGLHLTSEPGVGTTVRLDLPAATAEVATQMGPQTRSASPVHAVSQPGEASAVATWEPPDGAPSRAPRAESRVEA